MEHTVSYCLFPSLGIIGNVSQATATLTQVGASGDAVVLELDVVDEHIVSSVVEQTVSYCLLPNLGIRG